MSEHNNSELERLRAEHTELSLALLRAQALLNPVSGFVKRLHGKKLVYLEQARAEIRTALRQWGRR